MLSWSTTLRQNSLLPCDEKFFASRNSNLSRPANSASSISVWENSSPTLLFPPAANFACHYHALRSSAALARLFFIRAARFRISVRQPLRRFRSESPPSLRHARESPPSEIFVPRISHSAAKAR